MSRILAGIAAFLGLLAAVFKVQHSNEKAKSAQREADIAKTSQSATQKATTALTDGLSNESKKPSRGYFNNKPK